MRWMALAVLLWSPPVSSAQLIIELSDGGLRQRLDQTCEVWQCPPGTDHEHLLWLCDHVIEFLTFHHVKSLEETGATLRLLWTKEVP